MTEEKITELTEEYRKSLYGVTFREEIQERCIGFRAALQQVKKLNIDDVSKCPYCNSEYVNKTYNYCNSCKKHYN